MYESNKITWVLLRAVCMTAIAETRYYREQAVYDRN